MTRWYRGLAALICVIASGCSSSKNLSCVSGASASCTCSNGQVGAQVCDSDGESFGPCSCEGTGSSGSTTGGASSGSGSSGTSGSEGAVDAGRPIDLADAWVAGFYGTSARGINVYAGLDTAGLPDGYYVSWPTDPGNPPYSNVSDCSSFSDVLMSRSYNWIPPTANDRPLAEDYYWAIRNGVGFTEITRVNDIAPGDVIALKYPANAANTGHVAWIDAVPAAFSGPPEEPGLSGFRVTVIDSSNAFHDGPTGPTTSDDDRYLGLLTGNTECTTDQQCLDAYGENATCNALTLFTADVDGGSVPYTVCAYTGVGRGSMRLFADATGAIQGYSWSPNEYSAFNARPDPLPAEGETFPRNDIVIGRYTGN